MSWKSASNGGRKKRIAWSGGVTRDSPRHRWQDATTSSETFRRRRHRNRWLVVWITAVALLAFLVYLLPPPSKTPLIAITVTEYDMPVPPNAWALEDGKALAELNNRNIRLNNLSKEWSKKGGSTEDLIPKSLSLPKNAPLIVYISMHGIVDADGQPCLLPPHALIHEDKTWIRVADVLNALDAAAPEHNRLLILDCNRIRVNWSLGILYNSFAERVERLIEERSKQSTGKPDHNLAVILAAGPGEISWADADLDGSVFGRFLQLGLAGAADDKHERVWSRDVTLRELVDYLQREVPRWSKFNRGETQTPVLLLPKDVDDFRLASALKQSACNELVGKFHAVKAPEHPDWLKDLKPLWEQLDALKYKSDLIRFDPIACRDLEHELLRLEELAQSGEAYVEEAADKFKVLKSKLSQASHRAEVAKASLASHLDITSHGKWAILPPAEAHSLPASEYFDTCDPEASQKIREQWNAIISLPRTKAKETLDKDKFAQTLAETQLLLFAQRQQIVDLWPPQLDILNKLLKVREVAESLSVPSAVDGLPGDERAHYYTRLAANVADDLRRQSEDIAFVGELNAGEGRFDQLRARAQKSYEHTREVFKDASAALTVHDRALAETPYLAAWLCSPLASDVADRDHLIEELVPLVQRTRQLGLEINKGIDESIKNDGDLKHLPTTGDLPVEQVASRHEALRDAFRIALEELNAGDGDARQLMSIDAALSVPLIPAKERGELLAKRAEISAALNHEYADPEANKQVNSENDPSPRYISSIESWKTHPLLEILQMATPPLGKLLDWCDKKGAEVRSELAAHSWPGNGIDDGQGERHQLSLEERWLRTTAALTSADHREATDDNPISNLRRFDVQQLLVWLGQRAMNDFWLGATDRPNEPPFFARAAGDYFTAAKGMPPLIPGQIEKDLDLLAQRQAALAPFQIEGKSDPRKSPGATADITLTYTPSLQTQYYPTGIAALYLQHKGQRLTKVLIKGLSQNGNGVVKLPLERALGFQANVRDAKEKEIDLLDARSFFRGREDSVSILLQTLGGIHIEYEPHRYEEQTFTLTGKKPQQTSIVFILDCSESMKNQTAIDTEGGRGADMRMKLAKEKLQIMLNELAARNRSVAGTGKGEDIRVGVRFFGHRVQQHEYEKTWGPFPKNLTLATDVERILPLGSFGDTEDAIVVDHLKSVKPHGQTPLYLALVQALGDFDDDLDDTRKCIIAITDGVNLQEEEPKTELPDLLKVWDEKPQPIPIYIVGFDISEKEAADANGAYQELAKHTHGLYLPVKSATELITTLRERLSPERYTVREITSAAGSPLDNSDQSVRLNQLVKIAGKFPPPKMFGVSYLSIPSKNVEFEGGEALKLEVTDDNQDIEAIPFDEDVVQHEMLVADTPGNPSRFLFRIHKPVKKSDESRISVTFPVSLQCDPKDTHFTKRPVETWVEITPLGDDRSPVGQSYVFYDRNFEPGTPVPVIKWTALNWPASAKKARVRFWCKDTATPSRKAISLQQISDSPSSFLKVSVDGLDGIKFKIELKPDATEPTVYVEETRDEKDPAKRPPIDAVRVQFENDKGIKPTRVKHVFDEALGIVTHSFSFSKAELESLGSSRLSFSSARDVKEGAWRLPNESGLDVGITTSAASFSTSATRGSR